MTRARKRVLFPFSGTLVGGSVVSGSLIAQSFARSSDWEVKVALPDVGPNTVVFERSGLTPEFYGLPNESIEKLRGSSGYRGKLRAATAYYRTFRLALDYIRRTKPDIVHINDDTSLTSWGLAAKLQQVPVVWHVRQEKGNPLLDRWRLSLSQSLIFVAEANRVRFRHLRSLPPNETIHNGVDLKLFRPGDKLAARRALGLPEDRTVVGFIGNLSSRKRPEWFVEAGIHCLAQGTDSHFVIVGEDLSKGTYLDRLIGMTREAGFEDRFSFLGYRSDIPDVLRALDLLSLTSEIGGEAFPRVVIEAMATGVPVVATNVAGVPEAVVHGVTGYLANPLDIDDLKVKLHALIADEEKRMAMAEQGQEIARSRFSADEVARRIRGIYEQHRSRPSRIG